MAAIKSANDRLNEAGKRRVASLRTLPKASCPATCRPSVYAPVASATDEAGRQGQGRADHRPEVVDERNPDRETSPVGFGIAGTGNFAVH